MKRYYSFFLFFLICVSGMSAQYKASEQVDFAKAQAAGAGITNPELIMAATLNGKLEGLPFPINLNFNLDNGKVMGWAYVIRSKENNANKKIIFIYDLYGNKIPYELQSSFLDGLPLQPNGGLESSQWMDSDAMASALKSFQGYKDFMGKNPGAALHYIALSIAQGRTDIPDGAPFWWIEMYSNSDDENIYIVINALTGEAFISADDKPNELVIEPENLVFGEVPIGINRELQAALVNNGETILNVNSMKFLVNIPEFDLFLGKELPFEMQPGDSLPFTIRFAPTKAEYYTGQLQIKYETDKEYIKTAFVLGAGFLRKLPKMQVGLTEILFGSVEINSAKDTIFSISNIGDSLLSIEELSVIEDASASYSLLNYQGPIEISPQSSFDLGVRFAPSQKGGHNAKLKIKSNDENNPEYIVDLFGSCVNVKAPEIYAEPVDIVFIEGHSPDTVFTIMVYNIGGGNLTISDINFNPLNPELSFEELPEFPINIVPGDSFALKIRWAPTNFGEMKTSLVIVSNDPQSDEINVEINGYYIISAVCELKANDFSAIVYPNPVSGDEIYINCNNETSLIEKADIYLIDLLGNKIIGNSEYELLPGEGFIAIKAGTAVSGQYFLIINITGKESAIPITIIR